MPELPEVHTIVKDLQEHIGGAIIVDVKIAKDYVVHPTNEIFLDNVKGKKISTVTRIAKNILLVLEENGVIHFHLAMTGRILLKDNKNSDSWTKVILLLDTAKGKRLLKFTDMRMFGKASFFADIATSGLTQKYGPDLISDTIQAQTFAKALKSKRTSIKNALLDQHLIAGLGNIYATDALFLAKIRPDRNTKEISDEEYATLLKASIQVLSEGIQHRGSTLPDKMYVDIFGNRGRYQEHFKIYLKDICPTCNHKTEVKKINGRSTYFCPLCQK